jgi:hypothetical protein
MRRELMNNKIYNDSIGLFRIIALVVMAVITFAGIADAQEIGKIQQRSTIKNVKLWTENNNVVPVCWETPGYDREKAIVKRAVSNTWERHANLQFTWEACYPGMVSPLLRVQYPTFDTASLLRIQAAQERPQVVIRISPQGTDNAGAGGSAKMGLGALSFPSKLNPGVNMSFNPDGTADEGRVEYIAVHEFGHVLGFIHEQDSPSNATPHGMAHCAGSSAGVEKNSTNLTAYDPDSVMNYCNKDGNMKGNLTEKDIAGLQQIYGAWKDSVAGMLQRSKFRSREQLDSMSSEDRRNTLITELANRTKDSVSYYQSLNNTDLAGAGALLVFLRETRSRTDERIKTMSADDMRNTVIVETNVRTGRSIPDLQALSSMNVAKLVLKW